MVHTGHEAWWYRLRQPSPKLREDLATDSDLPPIATSVWPFQVQHDVHVHRLFCTSIQPALWLGPWLFSGWLVYPTPSGGWDQPLQDIMAATGFKLVLPCHVHWALLPQRMVEDFGTFDFFGLSTHCWWMLLQIRCAKESIAGFSCSICFVAVNSFFWLHVFALFAVAKGHCTERHQVWVFFGWARPRFSCCFAWLEAKRKSGWGICGSSCFGCSFCLCLLDLPTCLILANRAEYHFFHRLCIYQDRAAEHLRPNSRKKKMLGTLIGDLFLAPRHSLLFWTVCVFNFWKAASIVSLGEAKNGFIFGVKLWLRVWSQNLSFLEFVADYFRLACVGSGRVGCPCSTVVLQASFRQLSSEINPFPQAALWWCIHELTHAAFQASRRCNGTVGLTRGPAGIELPPAVCQRYKRAAIPTKPRGHLLFELYYKWTPGLIEKIVIHVLHGLAFAVDFASLRSLFWYCQTVPKMGP